MGEEEIGGDWSGVEKLRFVNISGMIELELRRRSFLLFS